jgi:Kef-type K+ transport system membrane component KefB
LFEPVLAAGGSGPDPLVRDIGFCLLLSGLISVVFARLRIPSIAAFLAAGVLLGPLTRIVTNEGNIQTIASLGLVLLLFLIGLELDLRTLLKSGRVLVLAGVLQFPLCVAFGWGAAWAAGALGLEGLGGRYLPLYVGFTVAASSTLLVVKLLQDRIQLDTVAGRLCLGVLIFQDIWAVLVLAVQPSFEAPEIGPVALTFGGIGVIALVVGLAARFGLPVVFRWISGVPELLLVAAAAWCFGVGLLGSNLGTLVGITGLKVDVSVSLEMGALLAGMSLASLPYSTQVISKVGVIHDFFITLFFVALGMQIPPPESAGPILVALLIVVAAFLSRYLVLFPLLLAAGLDRRNSLVTSTRLAQVSEFCLVIAYLGANKGHVPKEFVSSVMFAFVAMALLSPPLFNLGDWLHDRLTEILGRFGIADSAAPPEIRHDPPEILVLGFHRIASSLLHEIESHHPNIRSRVLVVDMNVGVHDEIRRRGFRVLYGDFSSPETLRHAAADAAKVVLCTIPDHLLRATSNLRILGVLKHMNPTAAVVVNAVTLQDARTMYAAGADFVFLPRLDAAAGLLAALRHALEGRLPNLRKSQQDRFGDFEGRGEILP